MKTIELTDEAYTELLELKNHISVKVREVTNKEIETALKNGETVIMVSDSFNINWIFSPNSPSE